MRYLKILVVALLFAASAHAQVVLRQSTAIDIKVGPFVDSTDGATAETALTISQADVRLAKNGGAWAQKNDTTSCTHEENGWYECPLNTTDTDTVGILVVNVNESGALQTWRTFQIVEEAVYDRDYAASATGAVTVSALNSGVIEEADFSTTAGSFDHFGIVDQGTAQAATGTTLQLRAAAAFADDEIIGATCVITGGSAGVGQARAITDYVSSTDTATVSTWTTTPTGTITYQCFGTSAGGGSVSIASGGITAASFATGAIDASAIAADAIGASELATDAIGAAELAASAIGASEIADGGITSTEFGTGAITATVIATDAIGAAEIAADAIGNAELATDAGAGLSAVPWNASWDTEVQSEAEDAINVRLEQQTLADAAVINCTVNTAFFAGSTTTVACILTDRDAGAITAASNDLEGRELLILSGAQIYEGRYITDSTWDGANSELRLTLSRALPGTLADAVTAIIR